MADAHWTADENRLLLSTPTLDGDTRDIARRVRMADNQRSRAYNAALGGRRTWEQGDPGRRNQPWRPFCWDYWQMGVEDRRLWLIEQRQERERIGLERYERQLAKARDRRRKRRTQRAWKVAAVVAPKAVRKWRRWQRRRARPG